jgi:hypothetical protein
MMGEYIRVFSESVISGSGGSIYFEIPIAPYLLQNFRVRDDFMPSYHTIVFFIEMATLKIVDATRSELIRDVPCFAVATLQE